MHPHTTDKIYTCTYNTHTYTAYPCIYITCAYYTHTYIVRKIKELNKSLTRMVSLSPSFI